MFLIAIPSHLLAMDAQVKEVILLIGLAVGVDYSLFYLKREREERAAGRSESAALEAAAATSGRSVLISGLTVMIAMAGMFFAGDPAFSSFAVGTILVVAIAMLGSLTVLPAVLSGLGDRVEKGRVPFLHRAQRGDGDSRFWGWILDRVLARPALYAVLSAGLLVAIAIPALSLKTSQIPPEALPQNLKAVQTYNRINKAFPTELHTATVVVKAANVNAPDVQASVAELRNACRDHRPKGNGRDRDQFARDRRDDQRPAGRERQQRALPVRRDERSARRSFPRRSGRSPTSSTAWPAAPRSTWTHARR